MQFKRNLESIDYKKLHATLRHTMIKHFTAPELEYIVNMYSQPLGRSVMAKMGAYTAEITPKLHEAMQPIMQANADFMVRFDSDHDDASIPSGSSTPYLDHDHNHNDHQSTKQANNLLEAEKANGGVHPSAQGKPDLPPRHVKVRTCVGFVRAVRALVDRSTF